MPSVSVTKYPPVIVPARNPVFFELMSNPFQGNATWKFKAQLFYPAAEVEGAGYVIQSQNFSLSFHFVLNPNTNGDQLPAWDGRTSLEDWIENVVQYFQYNRTLTDRYRVESSRQEHNIFITANDPGDQYTLWFHLTGSIVKITTMHVDGDEGRGVDQKLNLRHGLQLWRGDAVNNYLVAEDLVSPVIENNMAFSRFDVAELLLPAVKSDFTLDSRVNAILLDRRNTDPPFFIRYYEVYGDPPVINETLTSYWFFSLNGGIPPWKQVDFYSEWENFHQYLQDTQRYFLTWHWFTKITDMVAPERLYLIIPTQPNDTKCYLEGTLYLTGRSENFSFNFTQVIRTGEVYEIDVSFRSLFPSVREGEAEGYELTFRTSSGFNSAFFYFTIDNRWMPNVRYFMFLNSLGAFECVRFTGESTYELAFTREYYEQSVLSEYSNNLVPRSQMLPDTKRSFKTNTGWISKEEITWMQDFLNSTEVYEVKGLKRYPVLITLDKIETHKDNVYLYSMTISFEYVDFPNVYQIEKRAPWQDTAQVKDPYQQD
ncbi:MAG: hypothetical protein NTU44_13290 [Bacteroidetes bacterium]|nr:hypothetical protein [Bacteroidota bacterium]